MTEIRVAAAQIAPVMLDRSATLDKVCDWVAEAGHEDVSLVLFPEAVLPGYPDWVWRTPAWSGLSQELYRRLFANAVEVPGPETARIGEAAKQAGTHVAIGVNERAGSTLYNTLLLFGPDGALLHRHRKLMPTGGERLVWGYGDGSTLSVLDTEVGRVGGLICWENYMPLARASLYAQDVQIHLAPTWDTSDVWVPTLQHIAKEGRTYVIGCCQAIHSRDLPDDLPGKADLYSDEWLARGLSAVVAPGGTVLAGPLVEQEGLVTAMVDVERCASDRGMFDPTGHYSRPDVFRLVVDRTPRTAVSFEAGSPGQKGPPVPQKAPAPPEPPEGGSLATG